MDAAWKKTFGSAPGSSANDDQQKAPPAKVRAVESADLSGKVDLALKMATMCMQKDRTFEAIISSSCPIKCDGVINRAYDNGHKEYLKLAKGNKGHGLGGGASFHFSASVIALIEKTDGEVKDNLAKYLDEYPPTSKQALRLIRCCQTEKMHSSETRRLIISIPSNPMLQNLMFDAIESVEPSAKEWVGPRPKGYLEAEAQKKLMIT